MPSATISTLYVHPIKGCAGCSVKQAVITKTGLQYDREWAVVRADVTPNKFVSQREFSKLALVAPKLPEQGGDKLTVTAPGTKPLQLPLKSTSQQTRVCTVWEWTGTALDEGEDAAAWFTAYLGVPCRLVRYLGAAGTAGDAVRPTDPEFAQGYETALSDGFPLLLANEASLEDLNAKLKASGGPEASLVPISMTRFRPNIVISGLPAWEEDKWRVLHVTSSAAGDQSFQLTSVKPCSRCKVPTIDPLTAVFSEGEPIDTLSTFRKGTDLGYKVKSWKHAIHFAWNLVQEPEAIGRVLSVGDRIEFSVAQTAW